MYDYNASLFVDDEGAAGDEINASNIRGLNEEDDNDDEGDTKKAAEPEKPRASIKFLGRNIFEHILLHLRRIRSPELENTIQFLNQKQCFALLFYLEHFLRNQIQIELVTRAIFYIIKTYQVQLKQNAAMLPIMKSISLHLKGHFQELRDEIGVNVSAIKIIKKDLNQQRNNAGNDDAGLDFSKPEDGFNFAFWME